MEWHKCDVCDKSFNGIACFKQHEASEKHKKKLRLLDGTLFDITNTTEMKPDEQYYCSVCSISVSGISNYQKHVNSLEHAKMIQIKNNISTETVHKTNNIQMPNPTISVNTSMNAIVSYAECKFCQKLFSGPEPYQQHIASAAHIKKCSMQLSMQMQKHIDVNVAEKEKLMNDELQSDSEHVRTVEYSSSVALIPFAKCEICDMQFNGRLPYMLHLESACHGKKSDAQLLIKSDATGNSEILDYSRCVICDINFSGPVPYKQHLQGKTHKKRIIERKLITNRPNDFSLPSTDSTLQNSVECSSGAVQKYYCDLCKKQCSGPIPFSTHILSKDHEKNALIAKMQANMKKIKESELWPSSGLMATNSISRTGEVSSTDKIDFNNVIVKPQMNDLNSKTVIDNPKKFQMNSADLILGNTIPNLNIITPEQMDVTILGVDEEIVFSSKKKDCE